VTRLRKGDKMECACEIVGYGYPHIEYCPLHKSAEDLYEACKFAERAIEDAFIYIGLESHFVKEYESLLPTIKQVLIKAEGK